MGMIQIRDVPDDVHRTLKARAATAGMSLSEYLKRDMVEAARRPTIEEIDARVSARSAGRPPVSTADILEALDEVRRA